MVDSLETVREAPTIGTKGYQRVKRNLAISRRYLPFLPTTVPSTFFSHLPLWQSVASIRMQTVKGLRPDTFYHGTSIEAALAIQAYGFDVARAGTNAGALLGLGVYCTTTLKKAMDYAKGNLAGGIIFELRVDLGR